MSAPYSAVVHGQRDPQAIEFESLFSGPSAGSGADSSTITAQRYEADNPTLLLNATELTDGFNTYTHNNDSFSCTLPEAESSYQGSFDLDGRWEDAMGCDTSSTREESVMEPAPDNSDSQRLTREQNLHRNHGESGYHSLSSYNEFEYRHQESMSLNGPVPGLQDTSTSGDWGALLDGTGLKSQAIDLHRGRCRVDPVPRERKSLERDPVQLDSHEPDMRCSSNGANTPSDPTSLISKAIACLRHCMEALCIHDADLLTTRDHEQCDSGTCRIDCFHSLNISIRTYTEELSQVFLGREKNREDKRWWLATFYSLCIQAHVRYAMMFIESELNSHTKSDAKGLSTWDYLHQVVRIFSEDSSAYDPLSISWDIWSPPLSVCSDARLWKFHRQAREVLLNINGTEVSNVDSYASLKQTFGIAPDENERVRKSPSALCTKRRRANSPPSESAGTVPLSSSNQGVSSPPCMSRPSPGLNKAPRTTVHATQKLLKIDEIISLPPPIRPIDSTRRSEGMMDAPHRSRNSSGASLVSIDAQSPSNLNSLPIQGISEKLAESPSPRLPRLQSYGQMESTKGYYACKCCTKSKRFDTAEELRSHAAERPHECSECSIKFKNKSEADRHRNSRHIRSNVWSCALLCLEYGKAFHESVDNPGRADSCGFCGKEFSRSGNDGSAFIPTQQDLDDRLRHLKEAHKFHECESFVNSKEFYRADHFRQHLKQHAVERGRKVNYLESICMVKREQSKSQL
ncbi:hypothetical protein G7054_g8253 [Neopestalotiopsis clavispora]|nr:hypothetical protein G7054_g8253 [Neopestalotiopsis clavispora]